MPLTIPSRKAVTDVLRNYIRGDLPDLDTSTERRSFIGAFVKAFGSAIADFYVTFKRYADREPFPQTATGEFLTHGWWRDITKLSPNPAAPAHGYVAVTGTNGATVPAGSEFTSSGTTFKAMTSATISLQSQAAHTLIYDAGSGRCIFTTASNTFLAPGMTVVISGAVPSQYNGTFQIDVTDNDDITYTPLSAPASTPATGTPLVTATFAGVLVEATTVGQRTNEDSGTSLAASGSLSGVDSTAIVGFGGLSGGTDAETADSYRARVLEALGTDFGMFSADEIRIVARQVPGVTRVFVRSASLSPAAGYPQEGQVKIAFLRDDDVNPIPSAQEVNDVRDRILAFLLPAHTAAEDVTVMSPIPNFINFSFASITPDTPGMRRGIVASLTQFFRESAEWGGEIALLDYQCAIKEAFDSETRQRLKSFVLTSPSANITIGYDDYPLLGTVTFG